jgi:hypothetical protein
MNKNEEKTKNQGTSQPEASQQEVSGDMASEWEELVELDDVQLATVVGGYITNDASFRHYVYEQSLYGYGGSVWDNGNNWLSWFHEREQR